MGIDSVDWEWLVEAQAFLALSMAPPNAPHKKKLSSRNRNAALNQSKADWLPSCLANKTQSKLPRQIAATVPQSNLPGRRGSW